MADREATHCERLAAILRLRGERGITPLEALAEIGTNRLAARVQDLEERGWVIDATRRVITLSGARVACYVLVSEPDGETPPAVPPEAPYTELSVWSAGS